MKDEGQVKVGPIGCGRKLCKVVMALRVWKGEDSWWREKRNREGAKEYYIDLVSGEAVVNCNPSAYEVNYFETSPGKRTTVIPVYPLP